MRYKINYEPKDYQKRAVAFATKNKESIIAIDTGGGKTFCCIIQSLILLNNNLVDKVLQVCTKKSKLSFKGDYVKLSSAKLDEDYTFIENLHDFHTFYTSKVPIGVIQYEVLKQIPIEYLSTFVKKHRVSFQIDEYHKLKTPTTKLVLDDYNVLREFPEKKLTALQQIFYQIRLDIDYFTGYTATPLSRSVDDLFWLCTLAKPGIFNNSLLEFYRTYIDFTAYKVPIKKGAKYKRTVIGRRGVINQEKLKSITDTICFNYFPPKKIHFIPVYCELEEAKQKYIDAVSGVLEDYNDCKVDDETGEKFDKEFSARMIDAQYVLDNSDEKKDLLTKIMQKCIDRGVLVYGGYYNTVDVFKELFEKYRIPYKEITGRTTERQTEKNMEWFNSKPENKAMILTAAGSQSVNLQSTNNMIAYNLPYTPGGFLQLLGRMIRLGSKYDEFFVYIPIVNDTSDVYKYEYLSSSQEILAYIQGNHSLFEGTVESCNSFVLKELRKSLMWDKGVKSWSNT